MSRFGYDLNILSGIFTTQERMTRVQVTKYENSY